MKEDYFHEIVFVFSIAVLVVQSNVWTNNMKYSLSLMGYFSIMKMKGIMSKTCKCIHPTIWTGVNGNPSDIWEHFKKNIILNFINDLEFVFTCIMP